MKWYHIILCYIALLLPSPVTVAMDYARIRDGITPGSITFIGESHKHIESTEFIKGLVNSLVKKKQCLTLALELDDRQQPLIDKIAEKGASASEIKIPFAIDHPAMRELIGDMAILKAQSPCLRIEAIDTGIDTPYDRDEWMAKRLAGLVSDAPVLALLGGLHTLKKVDWLIALGRPSVAEILTNKGFRVRSFPQRWIPNLCPTGDKRHSRYVDASSPEALLVLNETFMSLINAKPHTSTKGVVDGFILWECDSLTQRYSLHP